MGGKYSEQFIDYPVSCGSNTFKCQYLIHLLMSKYLHWVRGGTFQKAVMCSLKILRFFLCNIEGLFHWDTPQAILFRLREAGHPLAQ